MIKGRLKILWWLHVVVIVVIVMVVMIVVIVVGFGLIHSVNELPTFV